MRVACVNLPWTENGRLGVRAGSRWPFTSAPEEDGQIHYVPFPFFLAHTVSLLKKEGFDARCFDAVAEGIDDDGAIARIVSYAPRLLVAETSTPSFCNDIRILKKLNGVSPETEIVLAGPHASVFAEKILTEYPFISYVALGEYEWTVLDLARSLEKKLNGATIPGLAARNNGLAVVREARPLEKDLDSLPWPERGSLPLDRYHDGFCGLPGPNVQMMTSRGCLFECIFCLWPQVMYPGRHYRMRNARDVVDEMGSLVKQYSFKAVYFDDDVFNASKDHVQAICAQIKKKGLRIPWAAMARADLMDEGMLGTMSEAGLYAIKYGVESADPVVLKNSKKNMDLVRTRSAIAMTKDLGIKVHLTFCLGLPGENRRTAQETIDFISATQPDSVQFSLATPFPGTEYYKRAKEEGMLLTESWPDYDGNRKCVVRTDELSAREIEKLYEDIRCHSAF